MQFRPLHDRVVVRRIESEEKTAAASSFPTPRRKSPSRRDHRRRPRRLNEKGERVPIDLKAGDRVPVRQVVRHRGQARRAGPLDHEGGGYSRRPGET